MLGQLLPCGGGRPIPLHKARLVMGRDSACDIPLRIIIKMTQALREADAIRTKEEFMPARQAELAHKRRERELQSSE